MRHCPFCRSIETEIHEEDEYAKARCRGCGAEGPSFYYSEYEGDECDDPVEKAKREAVKHWDRAFHGDHDFSVATAEKVRKALVTMGYATDESLEGFSFNLERNILTLCRSIDDFWKRVKDDGK